MKFRHSVWKIASTLMLLMSASGTALRAQEAPEAPEAQAAPAATADEATTASVEAEAATEDAPGEGAAEAKEEKSSAHVVLMYLPNRLLDLLDVGRLRGRLGPGTAVGVRATDWVDLYLGAYTSLFAGLPGPRMEPKVPIPVGLETKSGVEAGPWDATLTGEFGPDYSPTEFGASLHLLLIGLDLGIDPVEVADFFTGIVNYDLRKDDL